MGMGIYAKHVSECEAGLDELGNINSRAKIKRSIKYTRQVLQRERHSVKKSQKKNYQQKFDNYDMYDYEDYNF